MLTRESTNVMAAAKGRRVFALRVNCNAIGVPGIAASSRMPTLASGVTGKMRISRNPRAGIRTQFATRLRKNRVRLRRISNSSPVLTRSPIESITIATKMFSNSKGGINTFYPEWLLNVARAMDN